MRVWHLYLLLATIIVLSATQVQAQYGFRGNTLGFGYGHGFNAGYGGMSYGVQGGYGHGFTPSPQALYAPNGSVSGVLYQNGFVQGQGYAPSPPMSQGGYQRMSVPEALVTSAVIMSLSNRNNNYGYQPRYNSGYTNRRYVVPHQAPHRHGPRHW